ncbi:MAG: hypothetical protein ABJM29_14130 [Rhizobiaceae bacterium]
MKFPISRSLVLVVVVLGTAGTLWAASDSTDVTYPEPGTVDRSAGLAAFERIYEVASHPRCSNCHVGESGIPMWSGPSYGETRPHGMKIQAGESRIGAEFLTCGTCHVKSTRPQIIPHAAPRANGHWQLAPAGAGWFGKPSNWICEQLRDPARNGGMDYQKLANHAGHDAVLQWAWSPGPEREPAPYSVAEHTMDIHLWGAAGQPCPED